MDQHASQTQEFTSVQAVILTWLERFPKTRDWQSAAVLRSHETLCVCARVRARVRAQTYTRVHAHKQMLTSTLVNSIVLVISLLLLYSDEIVLRKKGFFQRPAPGE